jgi:hypothetical protein
VQFFYRLDPPAAKLRHAVAQSLDSKCCLVVGDNDIDAISRLKFADIIFTTLPWSRRF